MLHGKKFLDNMSNYEEYILNILLKEKINFEREKTFPDLRGGSYRYDFYIPNKNIIIEVDGQYHFKSIRGRKELLKQQEHDRRKNSYCLSRGILLYRIPYWEIQYIKSFQDIISKKFLVRDKWHNDNLKVPS